MNIRKLLIANRGEISIRISRAATELHITTVAVYTWEDRYSLHRYKADEAYQIGTEAEPLKPYLDVEEIIRVAKACGADAIHPGYGFLSENAHFATRCREEGLLFVGPRPEAMQALGDKVSGKEVAVRAGLPIIESNRVPLTDEATALAEAERIGFPLMLKAAAGGGGRGMRVVRDAESLQKAYREARGEAKTAFGDDTVFLEKFVESPKHIEVQLVGDSHGNLVHLYERDCSVQRRFQKVVEIAPATTLSQVAREKLYGYALALGRAVQYDNAGTVEFLVDADENIYFIEVNPRIQVEHTVTEMITGVDLIKTQLYVAAGYSLYSPEIGFRKEELPPRMGVAIQCRITTEDPTDNFKPDYGTLTTYRNAAGFGVRLDEGSSYAGMKISPFFDSMLVKVSTHGKNLEDAASKMFRALKEFRIRGVKNNIPFLENLIQHKDFLSGKTSVGFIEQNPELFQFSRKQDRGTKILSFLADVSVNGNPDVKGKAPETFEKPHPLPQFSGNPQSGTKQILDAEGPEGLAKWLTAQKEIQYTDTTLRDGHQSLLATRMRTYDMLPAARAFAHLFPQTFSMEVWGGATFDVAMRFLHEDPWDRLARIRKAVPNILLQMLMRGMNGVGYAAYPDNLIEKFVAKSWETGVDILRIFDSLNWMENIAPCIEAVRKQTGGIAEGALCYTGDILDPTRTKYTLDYYVRLAKDLENAGAHILCIKDMSGLLKPLAARELIPALKDAVKIPIHLHTHDTSSLQPATYLAAIEAGVDVVDCALEALSGLTSQPNFNAIVEMMRFHERENAYDTKALAKMSGYFETVRSYYAPFESGLKSSSAEVFHHEIPGGQYSNLKPQAVALGLGDKFEAIKDMYAEVNTLFGDIVKVTPSSKVVGDMAQYLVANNLTTEDVLSKGETISFPESVQQFFMGEIGFPEGGFPEAVQRAVIKDKTPLTERAGKTLPPVDFEAELKALQEKWGGEITELDVLSYKLYPRVFDDYRAFRKQFGDVSVLATPLFLYGMKPGEDTTVEIAPGKTLLIRLQSIGPVDAQGHRTAFFRLNGQSRAMDTLDRSVKVETRENRKADSGNPGHVAAPLQGLLSKVLVEKGEAVKKNQALFVVEAMKMETTVTAGADGVVKALELSAGTLVNTGDLVLELG